MSLVVEHVKCMSDSSGATPGAMNTCTAHPLRVTTSRERAAGSTDASSGFEPQNAGEDSTSSGSYGLSVKVEMQTWTGEVGEVRLERGRAVGSNERTGHLIASTTIVEPETFDLLDPSEGGRYLRALPAAFHGTHLVAVLVAAPA